MRDALSILDKIVSFTNGEVNYGNTLEHLNILDADYYFKLLGCMQQQDLAGTLLLYDDINRKGFEGDLVLEGLAEFFRNLLVCKDEKVAGLLEVVESFKDKYIAAAARVSAAYIISALNVLNEFAINYKGARNKKLHVELALIKLAYLQQAIELAAGGESLVKKKVTEQVRPVAFRQVGVVAVGSQQSTVGSSQSAVSHASAKAPGAEKATAGETVQQPKARLIVEMPVEEKPVMTAKEPAPVNKTAAAVTATAPSKIGALHKIRQQFANGQQTQAAAIIPLSQEALQQVWNEFTLRLKNARNPAAQSFDLAELCIKNESSFEVLTPNNLQCKFIEQERVGLSEYLQQQFNNRSLTFAILLQERPDFVPKLDLPLSTKEQYQKIVEQYPLVKELKDRLRLELDY